MQHQSSMETFMFNAIWCILVSDVIYFRNIGFEWHPMYLVFQLWYKCYFNINGLDIYCGSSRDLHRGTEHIFWMYFVFQLRHFFEMTYYVFRASTVLYMWNNIKALVLLPFKSWFARVLGKVQDSTGGEESRLHRSGSWVAKQYFC